MAIEPQDVDALVERIVHGAEEALAAELTRILVDDMTEGILGEFDRAALATLARADRARIEQAIAASRTRISAEVRAEAISCLDEGDARDVAALEAYYGRAAVSRALSSPGASARFAELSYQTAIGLAEIVERQNLAMADAAERLWYEVAGEAIAARNHGLKPLDRILADAVCRLAAHGLETIDYKSGIRSQLDVAVRRHVVSQAGQAGGRMTLARLEAVGHELVITSAHYGARPSHAEWQGRPCCVSGPKMVGGVQYPGLAQLTGYGTVGGLKGVNCRHSIGPYFPGITRLPDLDFPRESERFGMTSEQHYEAAQRQRELERRVRGTKREISAMDRAGLGLESPAYVQKRLVLGRQQAALRSHCKEKGLVRQYAREKAYGVGSQPRPLSRKPAIKARSKRQLKSGRYAVTQAEIEAVIARDLSNVKLPCEISYNPRLRSYGATRYEEVFPGYNRLIKIEVGPQKDGSDAELRDTILHEILEARIIVRAGRLYEGGDAAVHPHIDRVIAKYVKMKGLK